MFFYPTASQSEKVVSGLERQRQTIGHAPAEQDRKLDPHLGFAQKLQ